MGCGAIRGMKTMGDLNVLLRQPALPPTSVACVSEEDRKLLSHWPFFIWWTHSISLRVRAA